MADDAPSQPDPANEQRDVVRIGVDVGGTFTKAVAVDAARGVVIARSVLPTTHDSPRGPADGVVHAIGEVARSVGPSRVELVTHSTTQAVNALLEGDLATIGVLGLARRPDLKRARRRVRLDRVELSAGRRIPVVTDLVDITDGVDGSVVDRALDGLVGQGAASVCVAEAFAPDDGSAEREVVRRALERGIPACGSAEMTGLYGLELRTITAALNSAILPIALHTAEHVEAGVRALGLDAPVMVMRGDGGAIDAAGFRREPIRTLYSGPAASVAGVLRSVRVEEAVIVEVGGTSTNVAAIHEGRPALAYVRVGDHATAVRALDVRVVGVAGGSLLRARRRGPLSVGPRSAHIAGLPYACYQSPAVLAGAIAGRIRPRPDDPDDHIVLRRPDGTAVAVTNTSAAVALGVVRPGDYAAAGADPEAAEVAFAAAGRLLDLPGPEVARRMLVASAQAVAEVITAVRRDHPLRSPVLIAVGGGAGGLGRVIADTLDLECLVPEDAEVISSVGDALSFIRTETERSVLEPLLEDADALADDAYRACLSAGAAEATMRIRVEYDPERSILRAAASGDAALADAASAQAAGAGQVALSPPVGPEEATAIARRHGFAATSPAGRGWVAGSAGPERSRQMSPRWRIGRRPPDGPGGRRGPGDRGEVLLLDDRGDLVGKGEGGFLQDADLRPDALEALIGPLVSRATRTGRVVAIWLVRGTTIVALTPTGARRALAASAVAASADGAVAAGRACTPEGPTTLVAHLR